MRQLSLILALSISTLVGHAQEITRNNVYLEAGGATMLYSVNYERLLFDNTERNLAVRGGQMLLFLDQSIGRRSMVGIPLGASYLHKLKKRFLEIGWSTSIIYDSYFIGDPWDSRIERVNDQVLIQSLRAGIRQQPLENGLFWNALAQCSYLRVGDNSIVEPERNVVPYLSLGIGYSFR